MPWFVFEGVCSTVSVRGGEADSWRVSCVAPGKTPLFAANAIVARTTDDIYAAEYGLDLATHVFDHQGPDGSLTKATLEYTLGDVQFEYDLRCRDGNHYPTLEDARAACLAQTFMEIP